MAIVANQQSEIIFQPHIVAERVGLTIKQRYEQKDLGLESGIKDVDEYLVPLRPGELVGILAFTSNFKSGLMSYILRHHAKRLLKAYETDPDHKFIVVTATWEQSIEEQGIVDVAQMTHNDTSRIMSGDITEREFQQLLQGAKDRGALPWWLIGHSIHSKTRRPRLTMTQVDAALAKIEAMGFKPILLSLDYLQRIQREKVDMREGYMDIVDKSKDLTLSSQCPVLLGCQAKREVVHRKWKLPTVDDGQETSNFEQSCDKMIGMWMPKNNKPIGSKVEYGDVDEWEVTQNLLLLSILKQKFGIAPKLIPLNVQPARNEIWGLANESGTPHYFDY